MTDYIFNSQISLGRYLPAFDTPAIKAEPMLFSCDIGAACRLGGPITQAFVENLPHEAFRDGTLIIDTRVHMLMPGWFPAIPGWHHDDVPRGVNGQPNYDTPDYHAQHALALVGADVAPTQFAVGAIRLPGPSPEDVTYGVWHHTVQGMVDRGEATLVEAPDRRVVLFNSHSFHQAVPAVVNGWRWFGRASWNTGRRPTNELRRQVQVYLKNPMEGW